jgi:uncharacterized protein involved in exopolysaccharide biosynthesis
MFKVLGRMNDAIDLKMVLGLVRRQIWMILWVVTLAITFAVAVIVFSLTPRYSVQALVLVDTTSKNLLNPDNAVASGSTDNSRVEGEVRIVQSDAVLLDVIKDGGLISDPEFGLKTSIADAPGAGNGGSILQSAAIRTNCPRQISEPPHSIAGSRSTDR